MRKRAILLLTIAAAAAPARGAAQECLGLPSFSHGSVRVNVAGEFPDSATAYAVGVGAGRPNGLFANLGAGRVSFEGLDEKATLGFLEFGLQYPLGGLRFCPVVGGYFAVGPDDRVARIEVTSRAATAGAALGLPLALGSLTWVPNAAVRYEHLSQKVVEEGVGSVSETFGSSVLDLGMALIVQNRVSLQPVVHVPLHGDEEGTTLGVFLSIGFGWPPR
jgi:hypothetical protein